ncbi:glycosyltransferase [Marinobacter sp.]|uniref:glycosyltransferase n=1 Tax=Marinobacter sp. TaxID=50741 RepID=UPI003565E2BC
MNIQIVYAGSGLGLKKDAQILMAALTAMGHTCHQSELPPTPAWRNKLSHFRHRFMTRYLPKPVDHLYHTLSRRLKTSATKTIKADLVIHLENIRPSHLDCSAKHWLIPNQEWFIESRTSYLRFVDRVLCKTQHATTIFSGLHPNTHYLGFTGVTKEGPHQNPDKDFQLAVHVAGNSQFKGTKPLLNCWRQHPEWPNLVLISKHSGDNPPHPDNIKIHKSLTDQDLSELWQHAGFAIIPSEVEGYGQVLAEAMSHGCVTITTDAPPMNELIDKTRGFLVTPTHTQPFRLGTRYFVSQEEIEKTMAEALQASDASLRKMSDAARLWYQNNHAEFLQRLQQQINQITEQPHAQSKK